MHVELERTGRTPPVEPQLADYALPVDTADAERLAAIAGREHAEAQVERPGAAREQQISGTARSELRARKGGEQASIETPPPSRVDGPGGGRCPGLRHEWSHIAGIGLQFPSGHENSHRLGEICAIGRLVLQIADGERA